MFKCMWCDRAGIWSLIVRRSVVKAMTVRMRWYECWVILRLAVLEVLWCSEIVEVV